MRKGFLPISKTGKGFTLVELLVTIAIIGILVALALYSFTSAQRQARDVQAKSDTKQYQTSLEQYANTHDNFYPSYTNPMVLSPSSDLCTSLGMNNCPDVNGYYRAVGGANDGSATATDYNIVTELEASDDYYVADSDGSTEETVTPPFTPPPGSSPTSVPVSTATPTPTPDASPCTGCWSGGICYPGTTSFMCGHGGENCVACSMSEMCYLQNCIPLVTIPPDCIADRQACDGSIPCCQYEGAGGRRVCQGGICTYPYAE